MLNALKGSRRRPCTTRRGANALGGAEVRGRASRVVDAASRSSRLKKLLHRVIERVWKAQEGVWPREAAGKVGGWTRMERLDVPRKKVARSEDERAEAVLDPGDRVVEEISGERVQSKRRNVVSNAGL